MKVRFLKNVAGDMGEFVPGQVAEIPDAMAASLCQSHSYSDGEHTYLVRRACPQEEFEVAEAARLAGDLTCGEQQVLGIKNVVATPPDPEFDKLLDLREAASRAQAAKVAEQAVDALESAKAPVKESRRK
jgi:hypothetical protein